MAKIVLPTATYSPEQTVDEMIATLAPGLTIAAQQVLAGVRSAVKTMLETAYVQGRMDMLAEIADGGPLSQIAVGDDVATELGAGGQG